MKTKLSRLLHSWGLARRFRPRVRVRSGTELVLACLENDPIAVLHSVTLWSNDGPPRDLEVPWGSSVRKFLEAQLVASDLVYWGAELLARAAQKISVAAFERRLFDVVCLEAEWHMAHCTIADYRTVEGRCCRCLNLFDRATLYERPPFMHTKFILLDWQTINIVDWCATLRDACTMLLQVCI